MPQGCRHRRWCARASRSRLATQFRHGGMEQWPAATYPLAAGVRSHRRYLLAAASAPRTRHQSSDPGYGGNSPACADRGCSGFFWQNGALVPALLKPGHPTPIATRWGNFQEARGSMGSVPSADPRRLIHRIATTYGVSQPMRPLRIGVVVALLTSLNQVYFGTQRSRNEKSPALRVRGFLEQQQQIKEVHQAQVDGNPRSLPTAR